MLQKTVSIERKTAPPQRREFDFSKLELLDKISDGVIVTDADFNFIYLNRAAERFYGWKLGDVKGRRIDFAKSEFLDVSGRDVLRQLLEKGSFRGKMEHESEEDARTLVEININTLANEDGTGFGYIGIFRDLEVKEKIRRSVLKKSQKRVRLFIENSPDIITILNPDGTIRYENAAIKRVLGYTPRKRIGDDAFKIIHPNDVGEVRRIFREVLSEPLAVRTATFRYKHRDGTWRHIESVGMNFVSDPVIAGVMVSSRDITERKKIEEELRRMHKELDTLVAERTRELTFANQKLESERVKDEAILSSIGEGLVVTDHHDQIMLFNRAAEEMLLYRAKKVIGKYISEVINLVDVQGFPVTVSKSMSIGFADNYYYVRSDGTKFPVLVTASPVVIDGKLRGKVIAFRDVTREKELERSKDEFISLASHQLRTPLSTIDWYVETLLTGEERGLPKDEKRNEKYLKRIYKANKRMIRLVGNLLNVSRLELGTFEMRPSRVQIVKIAKNALRELKHQIQKKSLIITERYDSNLPKVFLDEQFLRIIFDNLLSNAVKYTPEAGRIEISISAEPARFSHNPGKKVPARLVIKVKDNGCGIPKNQLSKVFSKFFRADNVQGIDSNGTGLGLYITRSLVNLLRGEVKVNSSLNMGTTFYVTIPLIGNGGS